MDDKASLLLEESNTTDSGPKLESSRDEVDLIRKASHKETARVRTWRILVFLALLATAVAITATTYTLLVKQEHDNFCNVVSILAFFEVYQEIDH